MILSSLCLTAVLPTAGCSLLYDIGQQDASRVCEKALSVIDRNACLKKYAKPYELYEAERLGQTVTKRPGEGSGNDRALCFRRAASGELVCPN